MTVTGYERPADFDDSSDDEDKFGNKMFTLLASTPKKTHDVPLASLKNESLECTQSSINKKESRKSFW